MRNAPATTTDRKGTTMADTTPTVITLELQMEYRLETPAEAAARYEEEAR